MKTRKLRLLSFVLAVAMMFAVAPVSAFADDNQTQGSCGDNVVWQLVQNTDASTYTLNIHTSDGTGTGVMNDYTKTSRPDWDWAKEQITQIEIQNDVTKVGSRAFSGMNAVENITVADSVTSFSDCAFLGCGIKDKTVLHFGKGLASIPEGSSTAKGALRYNTVAKFEVDEANPYFKTSADGILYTKDGKELVAYPMGKSDTTFHSDWLDGVEAIRSGAFFGATFTSPENIVIPDSVKKIGEQAFSAALTDKNSNFKIHLSNNLETIEANAFKNAKFYGAIKLGEKLTSIAHNAFDGVTSHFAFDATEINPAIQMTSTEAHFTGLSAVTVYVQNDAQKAIASSIIDESNIANWAFTNGGVFNDTDVFTAGKLTIPTRDGYKFAGWYDNAEFGGETTTNIERNKTYYAKWEKIPDHQLTVTGGTFTVKDKNVETKTEGDTLMADIPEGAEVTVTFHKDAYADSNLTFDGWKIEGLVGAENYTNKEEFTFTMPKNGVTIKAQTKAKAAAPAEDDSMDAATVVTGVVLGTGTAILAYHIGTEVYAEQVLGKGAAIPRTREEVALKAWELAGKPAVELNGEPLSEAAQAEKWAVESGLMQNVDGSFNGSKKMSKLKALRTLDAAKKLG